MAGPSFESRDADNILVIRFVFFSLFRVAFGIVSRLNNE
jgi:hypothetical protein